MDTHIKLGTIWGVSIGLHNSWFLVFGLVTLSLATGYFPMEYPDLPTTAAWILGAITGVLFFGSVLAHELGHVWVALRERIPVRGITLFLFGGVAQIEDEPRTAGAEFRVAIAGPVVSLALAALFEVIYLLDRGISSYLAAPSIWLARINLILALFNLIPGFPLDGGRVLRAVVWRITDSRIRATRIAGTVGRLVAYGFMGLGLFQMLAGGFFNGLWLLFIGWFLLNAARQAVFQSVLEEQLAGVTVGQIMTRDCAPVAPDVRVKEMVEDRMMLRGQRCFFVIGDAAASAVLTAEDLLAIPRDRWATVTAGEVAQAGEAHARLPASSDVFAALRLMEAQSSDQLPVVENDQLVGMVSRDQILKMLQMRTRFDF